MAIFRITDWLSPPRPVGAFLVRPVDPKRDRIRGRPDAPLTLVEYGDFECPFCSRATGSIDEVRGHFERAGVARQKWPEELHRADDYPRTASGKVQKYLVRKRIREQYEETR